MNDVAFGTKRDVKVSLRLAVGAEVEPCRIPSTGEPAIRVRMQREHFENDVTVYAVGGSEADRALKTLLERGFESALSVTGKPRDFSSDSPCMVADLIVRDPIPVDQSNDVFLIAVHPIGDRSRLALAEVHDFDLDDYSRTDDCAFSLADRDLAVAHALDVCQDLDLTPEWENEDLPFVSDTVDGAALREFAI